MPSSGFSALEALADRGQHRHVAVGPLDPCLAGVGEGQVGNVVVLGGGRHRLLPVSSHRKAARTHCKRGISKGRRDPAPETRKYTDSAPQAASGDLGARQLRLQPVDRLDRRRVDAAQHREVDGDEVSEQHERQQALDRVRADGSPGAACRPPPARSARRSARRAGARAGAGRTSSRNTAMKLPNAEALCHPTISLWSASGKLAANAGILAFSLSWVFQRVATAAVGPAPYTHTDVPLIRWATRLARLSESASGPHSRASSLEPGRRRRRSRCARLARGRRAPRPRAPRRSCSRRPRAAGGRRAAGSPARRPRARTRPACRPS